MKKRSYKILAIGNFAGPDSPLGWSPNWEYISDSFRELGHEVDGINECDFTPEEVINKVNEKNYDFILTEEGRLKGDFKNNEKEHRDEILGFFKGVMERAGEKNTPVVVWLTNIYWGIMRRVEHIQFNPIFKADIVFSTDGGHDKEFEAAGVNHHLLRQGIYEKEAYLSTKKYPTQAEIGFIGSIYEEIWPYRKKLIDFLKTTYGDKFEHFGQRGNIRHDELNDLCGTLKIVVGDSVYSPYYWSNRVYEIIGRGGFFIHPNVPGLDEEFKPYEHYVPYAFGVFENLKRVIDYYLSHDEEREKIRLAGLEYCKKHHTYKKRVQELLKILETNGILK